ncbi:MAG: rhomboid family intramembrane serine protease [Dehalococcoidales bacterium]|nr:rhomboid family intramembrane serine protease [Dehalococcoidales bacterium]
MTVVRPDIGSYLAMAKPIDNSSYWTIVSAMFVHAGFSHIFFNMLNLYFLGKLCLQLMDTKWFLLVYILGGIVGNLMFLLIGPMYTVVVGASGAVFALGGVLAMMRPKVRVALYFFIPMPLWVAIAIAFVITAFVTGIAWQAHLGGLIVGLIVGFVLKRKEQRMWRTGYYQ